MTRLSFSENSCFRASFPAANRIARAAWGVVYILFFRHTPVFAHPWRTALLRAFGARVGKGTIIYPKCEIWAPWNLDIGEFCGIGDNVLLYSQDRISIGDGCILSMDTKILTGTHDYTKPSFPLVTKPVKVGQGSWLCAGVTILPGISIGDSAVIGAASVVTKDMPALTVCAGNPCRPVKPRRTTA
jgi:putative colanic acid biosynthesis acetyltransferase WcaF